VADSILSDVLCQDRKAQPTMPPSQYFLGIDLHKTIVQICVLDADGLEVREERHRIGTLAEGLELVESLARWQPARMAVEAVGLNRWFVNACRKRGYDLVVVDAGRLNLRACGRKTDRRDALEIARRLRLGDLDRHAATYFPGDEEYGLRQLERVRHDLVGQRTHLSNRIRSMLDAYRIEAPRGSLYSPRALGALRALRFPVEDLEVCLKALVHALGEVEESIGRLTARILERAKAPHIAALQEMVPEVGAQTALTLVAELGDVRRFRNARAAASYAGLVPRVANSADTSHHGRITKHGNTQLRWILNQVAVRLLSHHALVQRWAAPLLRRMHKNKVRTMLARRLLVGTYIVLARGEVFSLERCLGAA
jgi:transposase